MMKYSENSKSNFSKENDMEFIDKFPEIKLPNKFFKNRGDAKFEDIGDAYRGAMCQLFPTALYMLILIMMVILMWW